MTYLDLTGNPPDAVGVMGRLLQAAGVRVLKLPLSCPLEACGSVEGFYTAAAAAAEGRVPLKVDVVAAFAELLLFLETQDVVWIVSSMRSRWLVVVLPFPPLSSFSSTALSLISFTGFLPTASPMLLLCFSLFSVCR